MSWIKRNLYFLIGGLVAVGLMVVGGFYMFAAIAKEGEITEEITKQYGELDNLNKQNPHPGSDKIDNIKAAKEQQQTVRDFINKARASFRRPTPIPDSPKVVNADFAAQLRNTVAELHHAADQASVVLPRDYFFTFEAQKRVMNFDPASLNKLAVQLGEIKVICNILFNAKVNALDSLRREAVSADDKNDADYLPAKTTATPLAELTPYEVSFRCFSSELALVLAGFAASPNGLIIKTLNVEPAVANQDPNQQINPGGYILTGPPAYNPQGFGSTPQPNPLAPAPVAAASIPGGKNSTVFLNERQLRVIMTVEIVKLKDSK